MKRFKVVVPIAVSPGGIVVLPSNGDRSFTVIGQKGQPMEIVWASIRCFFGDEQSVLICDEESGEANVFVRDDSGRNERAY